MRTRADRRGVSLAAIALAVSLLGACASPPRVRPDAGRAADAAGPADASIDDASFDAATNDGAASDAAVIDTGTIGPMLDAFVAADVGVDAGRDAGTDAGTDAGRDAGSDAGTDAGSDAGSVSGPTVDFPSTSDTSVTMLTNYWNMGDYIEGTRTTSLPSITRLMLNVVVSPNGLSCDTQDMNVIVNGTTVGSFMIAAGETVLTDAFTFPAITGPTYTIRFQTTRTVTGGCGSAGFDLTTSSITLSP